MGCGSGSLSVAWIGSSTSCCWTLPRCGCISKERALPKKGGQSSGRSRGGLSTKVHLAVTTAGKALRMLLSEAQRADVSMAPDLLDGLRPRVVIADRGYDSDRLISHIEAKGARAVIPPRSNRRWIRPTDWKLYGLRNIIERYINKLKHFRRIATRYDKTDSSYLAFL